MNLPSFDSYYNMNFKFRLFSRILEIIFIFEKLNRFVLK
ncbi:hypothetical protein LEP1GSC191_2235 [Leptospira borgpetersenii serovar Mini str. 201000851]|uniref:SLEI domain protein, PF07620 family n=1 Tax=Leptospira borgpetersenii str. 200801926 TaxID=1193009 RepID=A0ABP2S657_LEPBO|nr:hypothetical protein LEP1GSC128_2529 [Leptospira borgpetersenii str. 200801926]EMK14012.1 hypothetical protein LEP1GSC066_1684 [Leptospira sp. serovar Kenya str. Sh9]ENO65217.1 hypothetical protein LEP1GSC191_2235 [Leptospira borgpetersenii serovar Mini str. 201000851]